MLFSQAGAVPAVPANFLYRQGYTPDSDNSYLQQHIFKFTAIRIPLSGIGINVIVRVEI